MTDLQKTSNDNYHLSLNYHSDKTSSLSKASPMPKPDFSSIEKKEANFTYKEKGSYKKPKSNIPESPMKSPTHKFFTPVKSSSNLFGNMTTCRKLNFAMDAGNKNNSELTADRTNQNTSKAKASFLDKLDEEEREYVESPPIKKRMGNLMDKLILTEDCQMEGDSFFSPKPSLIKVNSNCDVDMEDDGDDCKIFTYLDPKFENEYTVLKTLDAGAFGIVYKCQGNSDGLQYAVKKSKKPVR